ncbi:MAG TPA: TlpA disulfide reductase family protein [Gemmatimonadales bacterium]|nr:TlpA disulfide reductase family protein [Gemmatimonadales bacterium]
MIRLALLLGLVATPLAAQRTGDMLPTGFALGTLDGGRDSLAANRGMVRVVNVWATWCPPCRVELPSLAALADSVRGEPIRVYAVAIDDVARVRPIAASLPSLPVYLERVRFPKAWGRWAMPTTYVLDGDDRLVLVHHGATKWDDPAVIHQLRALARAGGPRASH